MRDLHPRDDREPLLHGMDRVPVQVGSAEFELGEVLNRPQAPLRAVDVLVEETAQTRRIHRKRR